ncbi:MAG TPA: LPXTG cell wall anchor domain-containing protein [Acidimicrobiales bacterium]|nr:LPXTG cell wall anchor domain-containing protein [Acidimicrobiales bacterium]
MSYMAVGGGTLAAAVLGVGTAANSAANTAASAAGTAGAAGSGSGTGVTVRTAAAQVGHELARTGVGATTLMLVLAVVLLLGGLLLVGLSRRHASVASSAGYAPPDLL